MGDAECWITWRPRTGHVRGQKRTSGRIRARDTPPPAVGGAGDSPAPAQVAPPLAPSPWDISLFLLTILAILLASGISSLLYDMNVDPRHPMNLRPNPLAGRRCPALLQTRSQRHPEAEKCNLTAKRAKTAKEFREFNSLMGNPSDEQPDRFQFRKSSR